MKNATIITAALATLLTTGLMSGTASAYQGTTCKTVDIVASGSSAGGIAKFRKRRAERRAISQWETIAKHNFGPKYDDFDDVTVIDSHWGYTSRGNPKYTVKASIKVCI